MLDLPIEPTLRPFGKVAFRDSLWLLTMLRLRPLPEGGGPTAQALDAGHAAYHRAFERGALGDEQESVFHGLLTDWEQVPDPERTELLDEFDGLGNLAARSRGARSELAALAAQSSIRDDPRSGSKDDIAAERMTSVLSSALPAK